MKKLIMIVVLIVVGIELGGLAFDKLKSQVAQEHADLQQKVHEHYAREYGI